MLYEPVIARAPSLPPRSGARLLEPKHPNARARVLWNQHHTCVVVLDFRVRYSRVASTGIVRYSRLGKLPSRLNPWGISWCSTLLSSEAGLFNMASKPTTSRSSVDVTAPNVGISGGRARGWDGGECPLAESKTTASTTSEAKAQVGRQERHGRLGDNDFSCSFCGDRHHRSGDCRMRLDKLLGQAVQGLMRVDGEGVVFMKTTEILEVAKAKKAQKSTRQQ